MDRNKENAEMDTPEVGIRWKLASESDRIFVIRRSIILSGVELLSANDDGHVILRITDVPASIRGAFLLEIESKLKTLIDPGITVWLESAGDKNTLRHLRAIDIRKEI